MDEIYWSQFYDGILEGIRVRILKEDDAVILGTSTSELTDYFLEGIPQPIGFDEERGEHAEHKKEVRTVRAQDRDEIYRNEGDKQWEFETITITMYTEPGKNAQYIREYRTSTYSQSWSPREVTWGPDYVSFSIDIKGYHINLTEEDVQRQVQWQKDRITERFRWANEEISKGNEMLKVKVPEMIEQRKAKLNEDKEKLASILKVINIPLKKKESEAVKRIQVNRKPLVSKVRPKPNLPEEYVLDRDKVMDIISIIGNQGHQFEKTPQTYIGIDEEGLRNIILVGLNTVFEGSATGETFSHKGKTDIYLAIDKGNILICECKIWAGKGVAGKTIDQLLRYLTWHQNYGVIITFVRQKNFSAIIAQTEDIVSSHSSYKRGFTSITKTHFISHHSLPGDDMKEVELHHIFFNLYGE